MNRDYNIAWEITENCNHNCFYCYNYWRNNSTVFNDYDCKHVDYDKIVEKLIKLHPISVAITGGEPLLVFDKVKNCIARLSKNKIFVRVLTNGSLITDEIASFFARHNIQVMVSFPTSNHEELLDITKRDNFENILNGLDMLKKYNVDTLVNIVVTSVNLKSMESTAEFLVNRYKYYTLFFSRATKPQNASRKLNNQLLNNEELQEFFNLCLKIKKLLKVEIKTCGGYAYCSIKNKKAFSIFAKGCAGGKSGFVVSNSGDLRVCGKDSQVFGNIFESNIDDIMDKAVFWTEESSIPKECIQCKYRQYCRGGCHMSSDAPTAKYNSLDFNADPLNVPKNISKQTFSDFFNQSNNPFKEYVLNKACKYYKTTTGNRFSYVFSYVYIPDELTKILLNGETISVFTIMVHTGYSFKKSKKLLFEMKNKNIITEKF